MNYASTDLLSHQVSSLVFTEFWGITGHMKVFYKCKITVFKIVKYCHSILENIF